MLGNLEISALWEILVRRGKLGGQAILDPRGIQGLQARRASQVTLVPRGIRALQVILVLQVPQASQVILAPQVILGPQVLQVPQEMETQEPLARQAILVLQVLRVPWEQQELLALLGRWDQEVLRRIPVRLAPLDGQDGLGR